MKKYKKIGGSILTAFLLAECRIFTFADVADRITLFIAFLMVSMIINYITDERDLYKKACERQAERWRDAVKKNNSFTSYHR